MYTPIMDNQGTGQTAQMRRLICAFVTRNLPEDRFSKNWSRRQKQTEFSDEVLRVQRLL